MAGDRWALLCELARARGYASGPAAVRELADLRVAGPDDLSEADIEDVIDALADDGDGEQTNDPDRRWALGASGLAGAGWVATGGGVLAWLVTGLAGLFWVPVMLDWAEKASDRARHPFG